MTRGHNRGRPDPKARKRRAILWERKHQTPEPPESKKPARKSTGLTRKQYRKRHLKARALLRDRRNGEDNG